MTKVGSPAVRISLNLPGLLLLFAGMVAGACFFSFKDCASLSKSLMIEMMYNNYYNEAMNILQVVFLNEIMIY